MANDARISIIGTVLQDPQNRQVNSNTVLSLKVGVQTTKKKEGSQWPENDVYEVSVWGKPAEALIGKIHAKTKVWVSGDFMAGEPWKGRDGETHISLRIPTASHVKILGGGTYSNNNNNYKRSDNTPSVTETTNTTANEEEIPF